jgi:hypothetical protein
MAGGVESRRREPTFASAMIFAAWPTVMSGGLRIAVLRTRVDTGRARSGWKAAACCRSRLDLSRSARPLAKWRPKEACASSCWNSVFGIR